MKNDDWPDDYFDIELYNVYPEIMTEYEQLKGDKVFENAIINQGIEINRSLQIEQMKGLRLLFSLNKEKAIKTCSECSLKYSSFEEIDLAIKRREFTDQVKKSKESLKIKKQVTFEEMCIPIEEKFKITLDSNITVAKFLAWEKRFKSA